jgi:hypothetical protein
MNSSALEPPRWTWRRWLYAIAAVFVVQAALIFVLSQRQRAVPEKPIFRTAIRLVTGEESEQQLASRTGMDEPTLLALPSLRGFSGPAWLTFSFLEHEPAEWNEPPHWLSLDTQALGSTFSQFVGANVILPPRIADKPLPPLPQYEPSFPNEPLAAESRVRIEGALTGRPLLVPLKLKSWPYSDILSNTTVQAAVDADGFVFSSVLLSGSGLNNADVHALDLVAGARFRPLPRLRRTPDGGGPLTHGTLVFQWRTLPLPATNLSSFQP